MRSADWQSAVARIGNPQAAPAVRALPIASRRHSRLTICATHCELWARMDWARGNKIHFGQHATLQLRVAGLKSVDGVGGHDLYI